MALILNNKDFNVNHINENGNKEEDGDFNPIISQYTPVSPIFIDDINPNYNWSKTASENFWCTGSGTSIDPYIIQNLEIDGSNLISCIEVRNSNVHFRIQNCRCFNGGDEEGEGGILLDRVNNSQLLNNDFSFNYFGGIMLDESNFNTISGNSVNNNTYEGIIVWRSHYNTISQNSVNNNQRHGIFIEQSYFNSAIQNTVNNNGGTSYTGTGINLNDVYNNTISENRCAENDFGIGIKGTSFNNTINKNDVNNNQNGILMSECFNNTISMNSINSNLNCGLWIQSYTDGNLIYSNCFTENILNAQDNGQYNHWDDGIRGNYWNDYDGLDNDGDGIGDIPYIINGTAVSQDNFPLMNCPLIVVDGIISGYDIFIIFIIFSLIILPILKKRKFLLRN